MAFNLEEENRRHQDGWGGFVQLLTLSTAGVILLLVILALTLL